MQHRVLQDEPTTADSAGLDESQGSARHVPRWAIWDVPESLAVFVIGAVLMNFIYAGSGGDAAGVPGHDSFYHIKMASLIPEHGLLSKFPWLEFTWFVEQGDAFVSHHYGFHVLLLPFVTVSHWLTGDYLPGARWAIATTFGTTLMLFNLLLITGRIHWRWVWLFFFLVMPFQFFTRHAFIRAISPSLMFMLLTTLLMFRGRYKLAAVAVFGYTHLYLGGVIYAPLLVGLYVASSIVGPRGDRELPWRLILWTTAGWTVGVLLHPYSGGMVEFLELQVFGSGLSPDIPVGREWKPYKGVWWFAQMSGAILLLWSIAVCLRFRLGGRLSARELFLLLANFAFLLLTFKARRFVEYWPVFCLLSSAFMLGPLIRQLTGRFDHALGSGRVRGPGWLWGSTGILTLVAAAFCYRVTQTGGIDAFVADWKVWTMLATVYLFTPLGRIWLTSAAPRGRQVFRSVGGLALPLCGVVFVVGLAILARYGIYAPRATATLTVHPMGWLGLLVLYVAGVFLVSPYADPVGETSLFPRLLKAVRVMALGVVFLTATACLAGPHLVDVQRTARCGYDLPAIQSAMTFLVEHSDPEDVVFTDDWDIFPVYFYYNTHNHYIVGLDPKFTHARRPDLWERFVKVSRGQVPAEVTLETHGSAFPGKKERLHIALEDIRDHFGAKYVITDSDHTALAAKLAEARDFAELIYPASDYDKVRNEPYLVFRVRNVGEIQQTEAGTPHESPDVVYVSSLTPLSVEQGWGDFIADRSVGGGPIHVGSKSYSRGLGTHTPSKLLYEIPTGYGLFKATVGINRSTEGRGSARVSVALDGSVKFTSDVLTGTSDPIVVHVPLTGARRLLLEAHPTDDGKRHDHVDWADARFVRDPHQE